MARDAVKTDWRLAFMRLLTLTSAVEREPDPVKAKTLLRDGLADLQTASAASLDSSWITRPGRSQKKGRGTALST